MYPESAKNIQVIDDLTIRERAIRCLAEFFGTAMFVFLSCMSWVLLSKNSHLHIAFTYGLAIMIAMQSFGHISGGHVNPAVTIAAVLLGHTSLIMFPLYFVSQLLGAIGGFGLLKVVSPVVISCSPSLGSGIEIWQGVVVEFILTFILAVICGAIWDCRNDEKHDSVSLRFGLAAAALVMAGIPYTGAHMNPARSFGPALLNGEWDDWWIWWIGPMMGAIAGALLYRFAFSKENEDESQ